MHLPTWASPSGKMMCFISLTMRQFSFHHSFSFFLASWNRFKSVGSCYGFLLVQGTDIFFYFLLLLWFYLGRFLFLLLSTCSFLFRFVFLILLEFPKLFWTIFYVLFDSILGFDFVCCIVDILTSLGNSFLLTWLSFLYHRSSSSNTTII